MHGFGVLHIANKDKYVGEFKNNLFDGAGVYDFASYISSNGFTVPAARYEGSFREGKRHGQGVFRMANGDFYSGEDKFWFN